MHQLMTQVKVRWATEFYSAHRARILVRPHLPKPLATQRVVRRTLEVGTPIHKPVMLSRFLVLKVFLRVDWFRTHDEDGPALIAGLRTLYQRHPQKVRPSASRAYWSSGAESRRVLGVT